MTCTATDLIRDALDRVQETVHASVEGLDRERLAQRVVPGTNTVAWLVWHLTRIQDDHVAGIAATEQVWHAEGYRERFDLPLDPDDHGFGHDQGQVDAVVADAELLLAYHDAVHARAVEFLRTLVEEELAVIVDHDWDPPVTMATRLVSVVNDCAQHAGQAALLRGILDRS